MNGLGILQGGPIINYAGTTNMGSILKFRSEAVGMFQSGDVRSAQVPNSGAKKKIDAE